MLHRCSTEEKKGMPNWRTCRDISNKSLYVERGDVKGTRYLTIINGR